MHPEIEDYLRKNGAEYTTKALRRQLLKAGYEAADIDAALEETQAARAPQLAKTKALRSQFWVAAWVVNFVVLVAVSALVSSSSPYSGAVFVVLGIVMLLGLGISGTIGSAFLPGRGLLFALAIPVVVALLLGGTCFAMMQPGSGTGLPPSTRYPGTLELQVDAPLAFTGSGAATCETEKSLFSVTAKDLGSMDELLVNVNINGAGSPLVKASDGERKAVVGIGFLDKAGGFAYSFGNQSLEDGLQMESADGASGAITFHGLQQLVTGASPLEGEDSISGTITWICDLESPFVNSNLPGSSNG
jgi:VanZ family protein